MLLRGKKVKVKNVSKNPVHLKIDDEFVSLEPFDLPEKSGKEYLKVLEVPSEVLERESALELLDEVEEVNQDDNDEELEFLDEEELNKLTKDGLNDYAAKIGLEEINSSMKKAEMIEAILEFSNTLVEVPGEDSDEGN
jgi:hypothetical protein